MPSPRKAPSQEPADDPLISKGLPCNVAAECSILGAILLDPLAFELVSPIVAPTDFFHDGNRRIFSSMDRLRKAQSPIDYTLLVSDLQRTNELDAIGGLSYLSSLTDGLPRSVNIEHYGKLVELEARTRKLVVAAHQIYTEGLNKGFAAGEENMRSSAEAFFSRSEQAIMAATAVRTDVGPLTISEIAPRLEQFLDGTGKPMGISTGFWDLDHVMACGGWPIGELNFIAAESQMGKTSLMLSMAVASAAKGNVTAIFSIETLDQRLLLRMCCQEARVNIWKAMHGKLDQDERASIRAASNYLSTLPLLIDQSSDINASDVVSRARRIKARKGSCKWIGIDYIQLLARGQGKFNNKNDDLTEACRVLKSGAKELEATVVAMSQLTKPNNKTDGDGIPTLARIRDSGELANQAYNVLTIYRDPNHKRNGTALVRALKNKDGKDGEDSDVLLGFEGQYTLFSTTEQPASTGGYK